MRLTQVFMTLAVLILVTIFVGCAGKGARFIPYFPVPVDADEDGDIDKDDVSILEEKAGDHFDRNIQPLLDDAVVTPEESEVIRKKMIIAEDVDKKLKDSLTVTKYERFMKHFREYCKSNDLIEVTRRKVIVSPIPAAQWDDGKVLVVHVWGWSELADGLTLRYAGIMIPYGGQNRFARISTSFLITLIYDRLIRFRIVEENQRAFINRKKICINEELVRRGFAIADRSSQLPEIEKLIKLEEEARKKKRGLWTFYPHENPWEWVR